MTHPGKGGGAARGRCRHLLAAAVLFGALATGAGPAAATAATTAAAAPAPACRGTQLVANSAARLGSTQLRITVINEGPNPCVLTGHPTLALAGLGAPGRSKALTVNRQGAALPVRLGVGGAAETRVSFTPVLGEADGYCASGAHPTVAPSLVVGAAGGRFQLAPDDGGDFALCGNTVRATAFSAS
ncbi:DUF4232 domain-containing protein [Streptomyces sp. NPDC046876]|uniref:DUF4232 domain-containing protein n=1 Tax=Streptomyces sp. NPDC046876 TaxID=3155616 RepID=UPI0033ECB960